MGSILCDVGGLRQNVDMKRMLPVGRSVVCLVFLACLLSSALAGERCRIAFDTVSYTHLDVYKRQVDHQFLEHVSLR